MVSHRAVYRSTLPRSCFSLSSQNAKCESLKTAAEDADVPGVEVGRTKICNQPMHVMKSLADKHTCSAGCLAVVIKDLDKARGTKHTRIEQREQEVSEKDQVDSINGYPRIEQGEAVFR